MSTRAAALAVTGRPAGSAAWLASGLGPRVTFAPDGVASITDTAAAAANHGGKTEVAASGSSGTATAEKKITTESQAGQVEKPVRPDWLPESIWDADKGFRKDQFDSLVALKAETDSRAATLPTAADKYEVKLPADFKLPDGVELPQGEKVIDEKDPRVQAAREYAFKNKMSQADFESLLAFGANMDMAERSRLKDAVTAERDKLGGRAVDRIKAVTTWLDAKLGAETAASLHAMMFTSKQIEAFERLMQLNRGDVPGRPGASREGTGASTQIEGYEKMTFRQRMAAIDARKAGT